MKSSPRKLREKSYVERSIDFPKRGFFITFFGNDVDAEKRFAPKIRTTGRKESWASFLSNC